MKKTKVSARMNESLEPDLQQSYIPSSTFSEQQKKEKDNGSVGKAAMVRHVTGV